MTRKRSGATTTLFCFVVALSVYLVGLHGFAVTNAHGFTAPIAEEWEWSYLLEDFRALFSEVLPEDRRDQVRDFLISLASESPSEPLSQSSVEELAAIQDQLSGQILMLQQEKRLLEQVVSIDRGELAVILEPFQVQSIEMEAARRVEHAKSVRRERVFGFFIGVAASLAATLLLWIGARAVRREWCSRRGRAGSDLA